MLSDSSPLNRYKRYFFQKTDRRNYLKYSGDAVLVIYIYSKILVRLSPLINSWDAVLVIYTWIRLKESQIISCRVSIWD